MTGINSNQPELPLPTDHWVADQSPPPRVEPPIAPPEPPITVGKLWRAHQRRAAAHMPTVKEVGDDSVLVYIAQLVVGVLGAIVNLGVGFVTTISTLKTERPNALNWPLSSLAIGILLVLLSRLLPPIARRLVGALGHSVLWTSLIVIAVLGAVIFLSTH